MTAKEALNQSGRNLQNARNTKGFSKQTLAVLSGIDEQIITSMEAGNFDFPPQLVFELADTLNVNIRQILVDPLIQG
jgi:ribosome-binding protein aMBF1 (putative translation factor)